MYITNDQLAARLREIRDIKGITAKVLGDTSGVHRVTIAKLETGRRELRYSEATALAEALGVDLRMLISDEPMALATQVRII